MVMEKERWRREKRTAAAGLIEDEDLGGHGRILEVFYRGSVVGDRVLSLECFKAM